MTARPLPLRDLAADEGLSAADIAFLTGLAESTISRLWDDAAWLDKTRGNSLQALIAVMPRLGGHVCDLALSTRHQRLVEQLGEAGASLDLDRYQRAVATPGVREQDLATAVETALHVLKGQDKRATAYLARFWGLRQDRALGLVYGDHDHGLLVDRAPLLDASVDLAARLTRAGRGYHPMIAHANLAHQVAKATGAAPDQARRPPIDRQSAVTFRSATMGLLIETNDARTAREYNRALADNSVLALVENWMFPCYTHDIRPAPDLAVPRGVLLRHTATEILREIDTYNDAYLDYLVTTAIPIVLRRDKTFGLQASTLLHVLKRRLDARATTPPATAALLSTLESCQR